MGKPSRPRHCGRDSTLRFGTATSAPSSSGPGRRPLKAVAPVQIRSGLLVSSQLKGLIVTHGGQALDHLSLVCH